MDKFRDTFYDGNAEDPECMDKPKSAARAKKPAVSYESS